MEDKKLRNKLNGGERFNKTSSANKAAPYMYIFNGLKALTYVTPNNLRHQVG